MGRAWSVRFRIRVRARVRVRVRVRIRCFGVPGSHKGCCMYGSVAEGRW